ncbi:DedA family protein [Inquilinus sp. NPDC058860]|uniref:DedA family protein n=1 Tax=Inquilinus sp. NPDC058860 TaxID=3346652 RepID=UPI0036B4D4BA
MADAPAALDRIETSTADLTEGAIDAIETTSTTIGEALPGLVQPIIDLAAAHPAWALALGFLVAAGESIVIVGAFVPGIAILLAMGGLVAAGAVDFWSLALWTSLGAVFGDGVSYWIGRRFGPYIRGHRLLASSAPLLRRSEIFFERWGIWAIVIARFTPGIRAFVPVVAGMLHMPRGRFYAANVVSAFIWAPAHIAPVAFAGRLAMEYRPSPMVIGLAVLGLALAAAVAYAWIRRRRPAAEQGRAEWTPPRS